jgi:hypothetical protein
MNLLWLGYDGLAVPYNDVVAVLLYQPALDARIVHTYGHVPPGIRAVVVVTGDRYWPSRWEAEWLRRRLVERERVRQFVGAPHRDVDIDLAGDRANGRLHECTPGARQFPAARVTQT